MFQDGFEILHTLRRNGDYLLAQLSCGIPERSELDAKSDFTLEPLPGRSGVLVREGTPRRPDNIVLAALEDGIVRALPVEAGTTRTGQTRPDEEGPAQSRPAVSAT